MTLLLLLSEKTILQNDSYFPKPYHLIIEEGQTEYGE